MRILNQTLSQAVLLEQLNLLYSGQKMNVSSGLLLAAVLVYVLANVLPINDLLYWFFALASVLLCRLWDARCYRRAMPLLNPVHWLGRFRLGVGLTALIWAILSIALFPEDIWHQTFLILVFAGLGVSVAIAYAADFYLALLFFLAVMVPPMSRMLLGMEGFERVALACIVLFLVSIFIGIRRMNLNLRDNMMLRFESLQRAKDMSKSEARFRELFERPLSPMLLVDIETGRIVDANLAASCFYEYPLPHLKSMYFSELSDSVLPLVDTMTTGQLTAKHKLYNGEIRTVEIHASLLKMNDEQWLFAIIHDITQRLAAETAAHNLAFYDPLTQLANRRLLQESLQKMLATTNRHHFHGALMFLDLDNFKTLNDTEGHEVGDQLLIEVARRLKLCVRDSDLLGRLGGDEFVVMSEGLNQDINEAAVQAEILAEKIRAALAQPYYLQNALPMHSAKQVVHYCSSSIGVVIFDGQDANVDELLKRADVAMYQAKSAGRNTVRFYDPEMQAALSARTVLEKELHLALKSSQFELHYQLQVDQYRHPVGVEALLRWQHPQRGLLLPVDFIGLIEETGLILPVGLWVIKTACAQIHAWQNQPPMRALTVAVNVSAKQFRQVDFAVPAGRLEMELTESVFLENMDDTVVKINQLKALGIRFALDDFGTGYSSLQYLKRLPFDQVKIDQSFVRDISTDANDAAIVQAIIAMAQVLNLQVVAEGVELEEQRIFLIVCGCHVLQGHLFAYPMLAEQLERSVADHAFG
jgi:diguanylate cyclase (GGDEF)-like protein/PAS domain S-box-containing protein